MTQDIQLTADIGGQRIDSYVAQALPELSRSYVQKLLADGLITVAGVVPRASYKVAPGDVIAVHVPAPEPVEIRPESIPLAVVYEDSDLIVVDKPAGMVVHPAFGHHSGTLVNALLAHCPDLAGIGGELRPGIVHRLDKDTSGLLIAAKSDAAHRYLQAQFKARQVHKTYVALVEGQLEAAHGIIDAPIGRSTRHRQRMAVLPVTARAGRDARTEYHATEYFPQHTLVEAEPVTGRTHQIRVHFAFIGHPIVGDTVYGYRKVRLPLQRHFLHATRIAFSLPSGKPVSFTAPLPADLSAVLSSLRQP